MLDPLANVNAWTIFFSGFMLADFVSHATCHLDDLRTSSFPPNIALTQV